MDINEFIGSLVSDEKTLIGFIIGAIIGFIVAKKLGAVALLGVVILVAIIYYTMKDWEEFLSGFIVGSIVGGIISLALKL